MSTGRNQINDNFHQTSVTLQDADSMNPDRFTPRIHVSGRQLCWPGVCTANNGWTVSRSKWRVEDIVGCPCWDVLPLETGVCGVDTKNGELHTVAAVLTPELEKDTFGYRLDECAVENIIFVTTRPAKQIRLDRYML